jgi:hypothetical protein
MKVESAICCSAEPGELSHNLHWCRTRATGTWEPLHLVPGFRVAHWHALSLGARTGPAVVASGGMCVVDIQEERCGINWRSLAEQISRSERQMSARLCAERALVVALRKLGGPSADA